MSRPADLLYVWVFLAAMVGGLVLTPVARHFARRVGVIDTPNHRKAHLEPVSLLGGLGIYGGMATAAWLLVPRARTELKGFFLAGLVMLVFGVQDDISGMDPWVKTLGQVAAALVLVGFGVQAHLTGVPVVDVALSVLWVVVVVNAFNFQDNMNGLAAGLAAIAGLAFFAIAVTERQYLVAILSLGMAGGCIGFLPSNYPRARIFMGDAGSLLLGFVLAFLGIRLRFLDEPTSTTMFIPLLVLALPLFDAAMVTVSRIRRGVPVTQGGTDHTSHRLVRLGLSKPAAVAVLWGVQAALGGCAFVVARLGGVAAVSVAVLVAALGTVALFVFERRALTDALPRAPRTLGSDAP